MYRTLRRRHELLHRPTGVRRLTRATSANEVAERVSQARQASPVAPLLGVSLMR